MKYRVLALVSVLVIFLMSAVTAAFAVDGINKKKGKIKKTSSAKRVVPKAPLPPQVEVAKTSQTQVIVSIRNLRLYETAMSQLGKSVLAQTLGIDLALFESSKDKKIGEKIVQDLNTESAYFIRLNPARSGSELNMIALQKSNWTDEDINSLQKLIESFFAPIQVSFFKTTNTAKPLQVGTQLSQNQN